LVLSVSLAGCAGNDEQLDFAGSVTEAYRRAGESMERGNYRRAIQIYEQLQARFPFSDFATQIQLELMYAYYKAGSPEQAIDIADTFMRENPIHARVDYALYIKALAHFDDSAGWLERVFRKDITNRPPRDAELAFSLFGRLVERYPASPYAADAEQRMVFLRNRLAAYENSVARYYIKQRAYVAALNRAKTALEEYQGSDSSQESLQIMVRAYEGLGMMELAADTRRVLDTNFPGS
ncbi:MAG: outer membrane protein assembly factor BamD, partial [Gammaproteobacteria bacterium]|nr:outer membrane protein assembly factor BamD [Gammaproteobacteria bacterium]